MKRTKFRIWRGDREGPMVTWVAMSEFKVTIVSNVQIKKNRLKHKTVSS